jgi:stalled ribosome rescue protein Dom34
LARKKRVKRGYPVALLLGISKEKITIWKIFSKIAKFEKDISFAEIKKDQKSNYNVYEVLINALRPTIKEGIKSIIIATPPRSNYGPEFISHIKHHHSWLIQGHNKISISQITGLTSTKEEVKILLRNKALQKLISETTNKETEDLMSILNKNISSNNSTKEILYSFEEIRKNILINKKQTKPKSGYLLLTDKYLENFKNKNQIHRVLQIAKNKKIKTRIIPAESPAGLRVTQLGGLVCLL